MLDITYDKQGHFPLSPGVDASRPHLNLTRERLKQNINITHHSPPHNENLRNQSKHWLVVKQRRKEERPHSSKTSRSQKSKSLA